MPWPFSVYEPYRWSFPEGARSNAIVSTGSAPVQCERCSSTRSGGQTRGRRGLHASDWSAQSRRLARLDDPRERQSYGRHVEPNVFQYVVRVLAVAAE